MPNAKTDPVDRPGRKIFVFGSTGSGKTTQFLTLPGKKFMYLFDPNAILSIKGFDVDYEEFLPDKLSLALTSLAKDKKSIPPAEITKSAAAAYKAWEKDFEEKLLGKYFDQYENIAIDSGTTLADAIMDGVLSLNGRAGQWPQQDDYGPQMLALTNIIRTFTALEKNFYFTGHMELKQDDLTKAVFWTPLLTGRLKVKLPLLFSEIFFLEARPLNQPGKEATQYMLQTKPDRKNPLIRCTMRGLESFEDVTLDFNKPLEGQGLGKVLNKGK